LQINHNHNLEFQVALASVELLFLEPAALSCAMTLNSSANACQE